jgi:putative redox protein
MRIDVYVRDRILPIDYPSRPGADPTPLEVLLASLAACAGNTLNMVLRRKFGAKLDSLEVEARAERREEHPTVLAVIELVYRLRGEEIAPERLDRAIRLAEGQLCPVIAMLRPGTKITSSVKSDWSAHQRTFHE